MDWICSVPLLSDNKLVTTTKKVIVSEGSAETYSFSGLDSGSEWILQEAWGNNHSRDTNLTWKEEEIGYEWEFQDWSKNVVIPVLCAFGLIGNVLNLAILGKHVKEGVDTMEKGALLGLMALSCSDLHFCLVTISGTHLAGTKMIYYQRNFSFYYTLYSNCTQNILIKTSSWFTVILSAGRYFAVCHPFKARKYLKCKHTMLAAVTTTLTWILLHVPSLAYTWKVHTVDCTNKRIYVLVSGQFSDNHNFRSFFICTWFIIGFVVPVIILGYCNTKLIVSLQLSKRLEVLGNRHRGSIQEEHPCGGKSNENKHSRRCSRGAGQRQLKTKITTIRSNNQRKITYTLIAIVICFFAFTLPSEIVQFYFEIKRPQYRGVFRIVMNVVNLMQVVNFSSNFVLYCVVNAYFRKTVRNCLRCFSKKVFQQTNIEKSSRRFSMNTSATEIQILSVKRRFLH